MTCCHSHSSCKGRFAPSPTGRMHLGNALCALLSWLSVRSQGGKWLLRIEDLDTSRSKEEYARLIEDDLHWLGLDWDEGGYDCPEYRQSRRSGIYDEYFDKLCDTSLVYPCWCSRADLNAADAPHLDDGRVVYKGTCRPKRLGGGFSDRDVVSGSSPAWRICVPDKIESIEDLHYGPVEINLAKECGDFIIRRKDGIAAYQLAVVVDDALMGVTEVVRGRDLLLSSPQQKWLHETLGFKSPSFAHVPLLCASDGRRLCKRDRDMDLGYLRESHSPEEITGMLANIAGLREDSSPVKAEELIGDFCWEKIPLEDIIQRT